MLLFALVNNQIACSETDGSLINQFLHELQVKFDGLSHFQYAVSTSHELVGLVRIKLFLQLCSKSYAEQVRYQLAYSKTSFSQNPLENGQNIPLKGSCLVQAGLLHLWATAETSAHTTGALGTKTGLFCCWRGSGPFTGLFRRSGLSKHQQEPAGAAQSNQFGSVWFPLTHVSPEAPQVLQIQKIKPNVTEAETSNLKSSPSRGLLRVGPFLGSVSELTCAGSELPDGSVLLPHWDCRKDGKSSRPRVSSSAVRRTSGSWGLETPAGRTGTLSSASSPPGPTPNVSKQH